MGFDSLAFVTEEIRTSADVKKRLFEDKALLKEIAKVTDACIAAYKQGNKVILAGNGGSAADAQHIAAEFVSRFYFDRPGLPSLSLSTDPSIVTAIGNDYGYENLFSRQIEAQGKKGDVFIAISTSGKSPNILKAIAECRKVGLKVVALTSTKGAAMADLCDYKLMAPSEITPKVQECHIAIGHAICAGVEAALFKK
jgi:D-sedoheptulose 7-phosphate isomerase